MNIRTFGSNDVQHLQGNSLSQASARADVHAESLSSAAVPAFPSWGLTYVCPLCPGSGGRRIREGYGRLGIWNKSQTPRMSHWTCSRWIAASVQLKPGGFLTNREPCIRRQNQFDHMSSRLAMQANLSD